MKISELIKHLEKIRKEQGDIIVCNYDLVCENYYEELLLEIVHDEYLDCDEKLKYGKILIV